MDPGILEGLRGRLRLGGNATLRSNAINPAHAAANAALASRAGRGGGVTAVELTIPGSSNPEKFMWGVHGFPPDDMSAWTMVDS